MRNNATAHDDALSKGEMDCEDIQVWVRAYRGDGRSRLRRIKAKRPGAFVTATYTVKTSDDHNLAGIHISVHRKVVTRSRVV